MQTGHGNSSRRVQRDGVVRGACVHVSERPAWDTWRCVRERQAGRLTCVLYSCDGRPLSQWPIKFEWNWDTLPTNVTRVTRDPSLPRRARTTSLKCLNTRGFRACVSAPIYSVLLTHVRARTRLRDTEMRLQRRKMPQARIP